MKHISPSFFALFLLLLSFNQQAIIDTETQNLHRYIWANYNHVAGNLDEAQKWYNTLFATDNASIYTYKSYLYFLRDTDNFQQIVNLTPKLEAHNSILNDPAIQLIIIQALEKTGKQQEAIERLIQTNNKYKGHQELAYYTANLYLQRKEPKSALIVIDNFLSNCSQRANNFIFYFLKGQILVQLGQIDQAVKHIKQCVEIHPNFEKGWLYYAMLEEKRGIFDNAIKSYLTFLELTGGNKEVEQHLIQILLQQNMAKQNKNISIDNSVLKKTIMLFEQKRYHEGLENLKDYLDKKIDQPKADNTPKVYFKQSEYKKTLQLVEHKLNKMLYNKTKHIIEPQLCFEQHCLHYDF